MTSFQTRSISEVHSPPVSATAQRFTPDSGAGPRSGFCHSRFRLFQTRSFRSTLAYEQQLYHNDLPSYRSTDFRSLMGYGMSFKHLVLKLDLTNEQIEDKFSPYAKETLAKLITFLEVSNPSFSHTLPC